MKCLSSLLVLLALLCAAPVHADSWSFEPKLERKESKFGDVTVVETIDARLHRQYPLFALEFWRGKVLLARYPGMGFDAIHASPDRKMFVGLSNSGLPGSAAAIFGANGELWLLAHHDAALFEYCDSSVTLVREWYEQARTPVEFVTDADHGGTTAWVRDCKGRRIDLVTLIREAHGRAAAEWAKQKVQSTGLPAADVTPWTCTHEANARRHAVEQGLFPRIAFTGETAPATIAARMAHYKVPAFSVAVITAGKLDWTAAWGQQGADGAAAGCDTLFQAGSIAKPVTVLAALRLQQADKLDLDADIATLLTSWTLPAGAQTAANPVTLRNLFTHTSGLTPGGYEGYVRGQPMPTDAQTVSGAAPANVKAIAVLEAPGSSLRYSGGGYTVAEIALQDHFRQPFEQLMQAWILSPAGMKQADFTVPLPEARHARTALGHQPDGANVEGGWRNHPEQAAAGLWATASDLAALLIELRKGWLGQSTVFSQETVRELMAKPFDGHAYGFRLSGEGDEVFITHYGGTVGYRAGMTLNLASGDGAVYLANGDGGQALGPEFFSAVSTAYGWSAFKQESVQRTTQAPEVLAALVGRYQFPDGPAVSVIHENSLLTIVFPNGDRYAMTPIKGAAREFIHADTGVRASFDGEGPTAVIHLYGETAPRVAE